MAKIQMQRQNDLQEFGFSMPYAVTTILYHEPTDFRVIGQQTDTT